MPGIASSCSQNLEILVFLSADIVVEAGHAGRGKRADFERVPENGDRAREAVAGTVASNLARLEKGESGLHVGEGWSAIEVSEDPFGTEEREFRGSWCG